MPINVESIGSFTSSSTTAVLRRGFVSDVIVGGAYRFSPTISRVPSSCVVSVNVVPLGKEYSRNSR